MIRTIGGAMALFRTRWCNETSCDIPMWHCCCKNGMTASVAGALNEEGSYDWTTSHSRGLSSSSRQWKLDCP